MFIAALRIDDRAGEKLARRSIGEEEVTQLPANRFVVTRNPHPRLPGGRLLVGETDAGRLLTVVIEPVPQDDASWRVRTAWEASRRERHLFERSF
ncbi:MAG: hypothetical protein M3R46_17185 [Actinomycetota bacterium]|nr:hypothetical protein [Actinomycetota bacterium]